MKDDLGSALGLSPALPRAMGRLVSGLFSLDASDAVYLPALGVESLERPRLFPAGDLLLGDAVAASPGDLELSAAARRGRGSLWAAGRHCGLEGWSGGGEPALNGGIAGQKLAV